MLGALVDHGNEARGVEIHVGQRGEYGLTGEPVDRRVADIDLGAFDRHLGDSFDRIDKKILKGGHIGLLAAYAYLCASFAFGRLFALKTKHGGASFVSGFLIVLATACGIPVEQLFQQPDHVLPFRDRTGLDLSQRSIIIFDGRSWMLPICLPSYAVADGTTLTYIKKPSKLIVLKTKLFFERRTIRSDGEKSVTSGS
jgi:hypothetical protein